MPASVAPSGGSYSPCVFARTTKLYKPYPDSIQKNRYILQVYSGLCEVEGAFCLRAGTGFAAMHVAIYQNPKFKEFCDGCSSPLRTKLRVAKLGCELQSWAMVTYKIETNPDNLLGGWVVVAMLGNHLSWEVGRYADERIARDRLSRIHAMMRADAMTN
jgi:hypothetical protein